MSDKKSGVLTEEIVRNVLLLNPSLAGDDRSSREVLARVQQCRRESQAVAKKPAAPKPTPNLVAEIDGVKKRHGLQLAAAAKRVSELKTKIASVANDGVAMKQAAARQVVEFLLRTDPNLTQRKNQIVLEKEATFLAGIGFSVEALMTADRKQL